MTSNTDTADKLHILVVDDDEGSRMLVSEVFRQRGHIVVETGDGEQALEQLSQATSPFDLVVLDIEMPRMNGMELVMRLRSMSAHRDLPILAVTARAHPSDAARILRAGFDAYLSKPVSIEDVRAAAAQLLDEGRNRAALHAFADALERRRQQAAGDPHH